MVVKIYRMNYKTEIAHYRIYMFTYGILSVLYVLKHFEDLENYEECQKIIDAIKEQEQRLDIKLFTVINKNTVNEVVETYKKFNMTGENALENSKYYSDIIVDEIKSKYLSK